MNKGATIGHGVTTPAGTENIIAWPKDIGYWCITSMKWGVTKKPSWRCRLMMRIFFDWRYEEVKSD